MNEKIEGFINRYGIFIGAMIFLTLILVLVVYIDTSKNNDIKSQHEELIQNVIYPNESVKIEQFKSNTFTFDNTYEYNVRSKNNVERITIENEKSFDEYKYEKEIIK